MNSSWVPSHVQITVLQARDLLLKSKNDHSEVYVCLQVEREKALTSSVPPQTAPTWYHTSDFPLMSLDTTVQLTVRQKGRVGDQFIGCLSVPLGTFAVSSKAVTHWYKLGAKPGKTNTKLRGELLVTIKFVSKWLSSIGSGDSDVIVANGDSNILKSRRMLKRSKSDVKLKSNNSALESPLPSPQPSQSKIKERLSSFRRSFRRKNKSPILDPRKDDLFPFRAHSPATTPEFRNRSRTIDLGKRPESPNSKYSYSCAFIRNLSDSDNSEDFPSPVSMKPSAQALFAEAAALENGVDVEGDSTMENGSIQQGNEKQDSPSMKFYNFRRKKRPWSIHQLSLPPTPTRNTIIGLTPSAEEENKPTENTIAQHPSGSSGYASSSGSSQPDSSTEDGLGVSTRRAKSNSLARRPNTRGRPRSYSCSVNDSQQSVRSFTEQELNSETSTMKDASSEALSNPIPEVQEEKEDTKDSSSNSSSRSVRQRGEGRGGGGGTGNVDSQASSKPPGLERRTRPRLLKFGNDKSPTGGASLKTAPALYTGKGGDSRGQLSSADPSKLSSTKPLASNTSSPLASNTSSPLPSNTSSPLAENPSKMEEEEEAGEEKMTQQELVNENSRKSVPERNLLVPCKNQDRKSGITNVRESVLVESSPRLRRGKTGLQSAARDPHKRRSLIETTSLKSFAAQRQHDALTTVQRKDISQDDINLSTATTEPISLPIKEEALEPPKQFLPSRGTASPVLTDPGPTQTSRDQSNESPRSLATRNYSDSILVQSRSSPSTDQQGSAAEQQTNSANLPKKIKHTVAYKESSARAKKAFQPVSLHPPSFTEYRSQTLPTRAKLKRMLSEAEKSTSEPNSQTTNSDSSKLPPKRNPENIMLVKRGSMIFAGGHDTSAHVQTASDRQGTSSPQTPRLSTSSCEETDFTNPAENDNSKDRTTPTTTPNPPTSTSKVSRSPSEIVANVMRNRRTSGGLRRTLTFYQENKKHVKVQKAMHERIGMRPETQELQADGRVTASAGNSPTLRRRSTYLETIWRRNPFANLRRTNSQQLSVTASNPRPLSTGDLDVVIVSQIQTSSLLKSHSAHTTPVPTSREEFIRDNIITEQSASLVDLKIGANATANRSSTGTLTAQPTGESQPLAAIESEGRHSPPRSTTPPTVSSSVTTLTSDPRQDVSEEDPVSHHSTRPSYMYHGHHQTSSSAGSEGFGSLTSEELTLEDLAHQDWSQWSKEDLVKELIHSKQRLGSTEDELKAVKNYLDNLLLRIMDTNPSLLSSCN